MEDPGSVRRAVRLAAVLGMVAGMIVVGSPAHACDCGPVDLGERLPEVDGAFVGMVVDRETIDQGSVAITFEVERVIKGEFGPRAIIRTNASGASCGLEFLDGPRGGLLLDQASDGVWESSLCQQVGRTSFSQSRRQPRCRSQPSTRSIRARALHGGSSA